MLKIADRYLKNGKVNINNKSRYIRKMSEFRKRINLTQKRITNQMTVRRSKSKTSIELKLNKKIKGIIYEMLFSKNRN